MFIASVRPSVRLKPKFGRLKTKFDDDAGSAKRPQKLRPFLMALTDLDFRHKFVIDNPEIPPYGPMFTNFGLF